MILSYTLSIILMLLAPVVLAVALRRRLHVAWWLFTLGMATFVGSQLLHFPLNDWLVERGWIVQSATLQGSALLQTAAILGFTAGLSETLARVAGFWILFRLQRARHWEDGVMVGLGHGGIEAMIFGAVLTAATVSSLWALRDVDPSTLGLTTEQLAALSQQLSLLSATPINGLAGFVERLVAMGVHVTASLLVWYAFVRRNALYALLALAYHATFDAAAVYLATQLGMENVWLIEAIFLLVALPGIVWSWRLGRERRAVVTGQARLLRTELNLFVVAVRKELLQQWRTKRVLVIGAVFALFGLLSPLLAYFTPQLLTSIEGAEQFAELIPDPTVSDALGQYVKNITQFGFIIAVLLGMGAVAGEKERGTTAMVLSKPLPRWAFVLSKFVAQALVYLVAFIIAAFGAYYYTEYLFDGLLLAPFLFGNLLLLLWLLTFAAVTLLGSTFANSTGSAAALALGGAIVLLLAGGIPQLAAFAPGALVGWASQLGLAGAPAGNAGAVVSNVVIVMVCLILAVAAFEEQEL